LLIIENNPQSNGVIQTPFLLSIWLTLALGNQLNTMMT